MIKPSFFERSELSRALYSFRREFLWVGIFSMIANVLMLSPTLYMLQVYDRVLMSQSELTLLFLTIIIVVFFCMMAELGHDESNPRTSRWVFGLCKTRLV